MRNHCPLIALLVALASTAAVQAQYLYVTNEGVITITHYTGLSGAVVIPGTIAGLPVTTIGDGAFLSCTNLSQVTIPESVTSIGDDAFAGCYSLSDIAIPSAVTSIGASAFSGSGLTSVAIPNRVITIGDYAFSDCPGLTGVSIPTSVTIIGKGAFSDCANLISVTIPNSVTYIGSQAFAYSGLTTVTVPRSVAGIGDYAFLNCSSLGNLYFTGNAPTMGLSVLGDDHNVSVYYLPGTIGWGATFAGQPTKLWNPLIQAGSVGFGMYIGQFGFNITGTSNTAVVVEATASLVAPVWTPLQTVTLTNGSHYFSDSLQSNSAGRFYRLSLP